MALLVSFRTALDGELRATMVVQLAKYLLFMRGQIPCLYDELLQFVESFQLQQQGRAQDFRRRRLPVTGGIRKAVKCVEAAEQLFKVQLDAIFSLRVKRVALVFGSSMMSPREAVIMEFDDEAELVDVLRPASPQTDQEDTSLEDSQTLTPPSPPMTREKLKRLCAQKLMREVFTHSMEHFSSALSATKLHIAVLAERQSTRIPGFLPKQQFKLRLPKDKHGVRTHYVKICSGVGSRQPSQQDGVQQPPTEQVKSEESTSSVAAHMLADTSDPTLMWYVLEKPIPGFSEAIATLN